jgi:hypothetical protein
MRGVMSANTSLGYVVTIHDGRVELQGQECWIA